MNTLLHSAGAQTELGWVLGVMTLIFLLTFVGWTWWAWSARNRQAMEEASRMPLSDGGES